MIAQRFDRGQCFGLDRSECEGLIGLKQGRGNGAQSREAKNQHRAAFYPPNCGPSRLAMAYSKRKSDCLRLSWDVPDAGK
jgi:hypothetical protein